MAARRQRLATGVVLIVAGLVLFALQQGRGLGEATVFLVLGAAFLAAYVYRKVYGLLVPAGIMLGLALGRLAAEPLSTVGDPGRLGLGIGFLLIWGIAKLYQGESHWWPLVPGAILVVTALPMTRHLVDGLLDRWPLILVVIGVILVFTGMAAGRSGRTS
ncbi:MAG: hypothetical protein R2991_06625 [Thermoanaerobaculia bacterium]